MRLQIWLRPCCYLSHFLDLRSAARSLSCALLSLTRLDPTQQSHLDRLVTKAYIFALINRTHVWRTPRLHWHLAGTRISAAWDARIHILRSPALFLFLFLFLSLCLSVSYFFISSWPPGGPLGISRIYPIRLLTYRAPPPILVHVHVLHNLSPALYLLTHSTLQMHR